MLKPRHAIVCILGLAAVASCGGGGGGGGGSSAPPTSAPTSSASPTPSPTPTGSSLPACTDAVSRTPIRVAKSSRSLTSLRPMATASPVGTPTPCAGFIEYSLPTNNSGPTSIAPGQSLPSISDSNVWVTETAVNQIAIVSPFGLISEFIMPAGTAPQFLAQLWNQAPTTATLSYKWIVLEPGSFGLASLDPTQTPVAIAQLAPGTVGTTLGGSASAGGPHGKAVWFSETSAGKIAEISTADGNYPAANEFPLTTPNSGPTVMAQGSDGNLWVYESSVNKLAQVSSGGSVLAEYTTLPANAGVSAITASSGKASSIAVYVAEANLNKIAAVTTTGAVTQYSIPSAGSGINALVSDGVGNVWFTEPNTNKIGEMTPTGQFTEVSVPTANAGLAGISLGNGGTTTSTQVCCADNRIWFTEKTAGKVGVYNP